MDENRETTVIMEFVRSASGADDRARVTRRRAVAGRASVMDAADLDLAPGTQGSDLRWLVRLVPALVVAMAPGR